ncbi:MAG: MFS transporter [Zavarzinella sp.]
MTSDSQPPDNDRKKARSAMFIVFFVVLIDLLGFGIVLPLLPRISEQLLTTAAVATQWHGLIIGGVLSVFSLMQFLVAPLWGQVSDRIGRRPVLLIGLVGSVVFYILFGVACTLIATKPQLALILMFVSRFGAGIAGATISTAQAVIADCTPKEKRSHGMAMIGIAFGVGFTIGPIIAGVALAIMPNNLELTGYFAAGLSFIALLMGLRMLPETRKFGNHSARRGWIDTKGMFNTLKTPTVGLLVLIFFLATFGFAKFESTLALLTGDFGYDIRDNFWIFAYVGFVLMLTQGLLYRRMVKKLFEVRMMQLGLVFMFVGLLFLATVAVWQAAPARQLLFFVALAVGVVGFAFLTPSVQALISIRSDPNRQGEVLGVNQAFSALARILGPVVGIVLFKAHSSHILPYVAAGLLMLPVFAMLPKIKRTPAEKAAS